MSQFSYPFSNCVTSLFWMALIYTNIMKHKLLFSVLRVLNKNTFPLINNERFANTSHIVLTNYAVINQLLFPRANYYFFSLVDLNLKYSYILLPSLLSFHFFILSFRTSCYKCNLDVTKQLPLFYLWTIFAITYPRSKIFRLYNHS